MMVEFLFRKSEINLSIFFSLPHFSVHLSLKEEEEVQQNSSLQAEHCQKGVKMWVEEEREMKNMSLAVKSRE